MRLVKTVSKTSLSTFTLYPTVYTLPYTVYSIFPMLPVDWAAVESVEGGDRLSISVRHGGPADRGKISIVVGRISRTVGILAISWEN